MNTRTFFVTVTNDKCEVLDRITVEVHDPIISALLVSDLKGNGTRGVLRIGRQKSDAVMVNVVNSKGQRVARFDASKSDKPFLEALKDCASRTSCPECARSFGPHYTGKCEH